MARPGGHMIYIGLYREKHDKIFLSKTTKLEALIFGIKHHHVNLYQVCSNYILHKEKHEKVFLSETLPSLFKLYPWGQKWPASGVTCFT